MSDNSYRWIAGFGKVPSCHFILMATDQKRNHTREWNNASAAGSRHLQSLSIRYQRRLTHICWFRKRMSWGIEHIKFSNPQQRVDINADQAVCRNTRCSTLLIEMMLYHVDLYCFQKHIPYILLMVIDVRLSNPCLNQSLIDTLKLAHNSNITHTFDRVSKMYLAD